MEFHLLGTSFWGKKYLFFSKWAQLVLSTEQIIDAKEKKKQQKKYTHLMNNGEKALIVKWKKEVRKFFKFKF